ncbi:hypothetical protein N9W34_05270 [Rickettsiales bacterium]|nr:hypothetical protein [Rickettsiales bacterium]
MNNEVDSNFSSVLPLDTEQFNEITQGKNTLQNDILDLFFFNAEECISVMVRHSTDSRSSSHSWKFASEELINLSEYLGAAELAKISKLASKMGDDTVENKTKITKALKASLARLRAFTRNTRS